MTENINRPHGMLWPKADLDKNAVMLIGRGGQPLAQLSAYKAVYLAMELLKKAEPLIGPAFPDARIPEDECTALDSALSLVEAWARTLRAEVADRRVVQDLAPPLPDVA